MPEHQSDFSWWTAALAGTRGPIYDGEPQHGFYRQRNQAKQYEPVAYWKDGATGDLRCHVNGRAPDPQRALEMWPYVSKNPITAEAYWHFMDNKVWLDNDQAAHDAAKGPEIDPAADPVGSLKAELAAAKKGVPAYATIDSDEQAAKAQTLRSTLTTIKNKAQSSYEALNRPLLDEQQRIRKVWFPIRDEAETEAESLRAAMSSWETLKLQNARKAQAAVEAAEREAARKTLADQEAHAKATAAAEKKGEAPPPAPEPVRVAAPPPNTAAIPAPSTKIKGASGRAASVQLKKVVTDIDIDKAFAQFRDTPELKAFLLDLSQQTVDAGFVAIGATIEEKADIR